MNTFLILNRSWQMALRRAAQRREFENLMVANRWIRTLDRFRLWPRWWGDDFGD